MNSNLNMSIMKSTNIRTFHLGIKFPIGYLAGLKKLGASAQYNNKSREKLFTCSLMKFSYPDRIRMRKDLERNGFSCHEGERYAIGRCRKIPGVTSSQFSLLEESYETKALKFQKQCVFKFRSFRPQKSFFPWWFVSDNTYIAERGTDSNNTE